MNITILGKPISVNRSYGRGKNSFYMTQIAKQYKMSASLQAKQQYKGEPLTNKLEVKYTYYFPDKRVRDHLNLNKGLNDALNEIVWKDDKQIIISHHYEDFDKENPRIELEIYEIT